MNPVLVHVDVRESGRSDQARQVPFARATLDSRTELDQGLRPVGEGLGLDVTHVPVDVATEEERQQTSDRAGPNISRAELFQG